jgi:hypothetical protein
MKESAVKVKMKRSPYSSLRQQPGKTCSRQANRAIAAGAFFDLDSFLTWTSAWRKALAYRLPARPPQVTPLK